MSIPGSVVPQLVVNAVLVAGLAAYLPRSLRRRKNRCVVIAVLLMGAFGLVVNLSGHPISGWQEGFHVG